jgi:hypothetical protein
MRLPAHRVHAAALLLALSFPFTPHAHAAPERTQTFHLMEITQIMAAYNGNTNIQAVEMKMISGAQNHVTGTVLNLYDKNANFVANLGSFGADLPNGTAGARVLCATSQFASAFGITPDLVLTPGIPPTTGQVVFELEIDCIVNSIPYGGVVTRIASSSSAPPLPTLGATALVRTVDTTNPPSCPLNENAGARFTIRSGTLGAPLVFQNNSGDTTQVSSTVTAVEPSPLPAAVLLRAIPNPFRGETRVESPDWAPLVIHDVRGRLVRVLTCEPGGACPEVAGAFRGTWDGRDMKGRLAPSGVYFLRYTGPSGQAVKPIVLLR